MRPSEIVGDDVSIQFAVLWKDAGFEGWELRSLEHLLTMTDVRATLLIRTDPHSARADPLPALLATLPSIAVGQRPPRDLDFILSFTDQPCPPELLGVARHGVWAFRFGAAALARAADAGFWEVYEDQPLTSAQLVSQRSAPDGVVVLREGHLRTHRLSCSANRQEVLDRIARWPALACTDLVNGIDSRMRGPALDRAVTARAPPTAAQRLVCKVRVAARALQTLVRSLCRHDQWNIGYVERPISWFLKPDRPREVAWLEPPGRDEFFADPFGTWRDGRLTILYERFSYRTNLGTIAAVESAGGAPGLPVDIGPSPAVHLSYPYLFEAGNRLLCIPETHQAAEIGLYEVGRFPDRWTKIADLVRGMAIVDATVFPHEGRWWLAGSEATAKGTTCELHLWHAENPVGPWHPHAANPVKVDVRSSRPAGTPFVEDGALYRPAQDCSTTYGGRVVINRVVTLTPTDFAEIEAAVVEPDPEGPYPAGLHTLSAAGSGTLIDSKRTIFSPAECRRVLRHHLRSALRLLRG